MKITEVGIEKLNAYANNPRKNAKAVPALMESIKEFGVQMPIVINDDNVVICGHTTLEAVKRLGMKTIPCVIADDLTEEQQKAFRLVDNKVAEASQWDFDKLEAEMSKILDIDMDRFGFADDEMDTQFQDNTELDADSFGDEEFAHECPECGFKWN